MVAINLSFSDPTFQLILFIFLPYAFRYVTSFFRSKPKLPHRPPRPYTFSDYAVASLLTFTIFYELTFAFLRPPPNIFKSLHLPLNTPALKLRQTLVQNYDLFPGAEGDLLVEQLQSIESRVIYTTYGQDAFLNCTYCRENSDYLLYILPTLAGSYVFASFVLGFATITRRKQPYRMYGTMALTCAAAFELYSFVYVDRRVALGDSFFFDMADRYRRLAIAIGATVLLFVGSSSEDRTYTEIVADTSAQLQLVIARQRALAIQRSAVMRDPNLRTTFNEFHKRVGVESSVISDDKEYREARARALAKMNMDEFVREAESYVNNMVDAGFAIVDKGKGKEVEEGSSNKQD